MLMVGIDPFPCKGGIHIAFKALGLIRFDNESFVGSSKQISPNALHGDSVRLLGIAHETSTSIHSVSKIRS